ncbi:hypothetical protein NB037_17020 [Rathayibacter sp. ZW T2_19]|uniref:Uncharacterized protein n=1 Tax=Rathayibacter rubneri TaxID=2950106 RepID=A0A9X2E249_9MICO|nr:hypothetical protein [Rathayibacter rubneri]MCM6764118.1 hypothetical protein [Rathayibacter rubneri]
MTRVELHYGGRLYTMGNVSVQEAKQLVAEVLGTEPHWLEVNQGEGDLRTAHLLLTPGVALALSVAE